MFRIFIFPLNAIHPEILSKLIRRAFKGSILMIPGFLLMISYTVSISLYCCNALVKVPLLPQYDKGLGGQNFINY